MNGKFGDLVSKSGVDYVFNSLNLRFISQLRSVYIPLLTHDVPLSTSQEDHEQVSTKLQKDLLIEKAVTAYSWGDLRNVIRLLLVAKTNDTEWIRFSVPA